MLRGLLVLIIMSIIITPAMAGGLMKTSYSISPSEPQEWVGRHADQLVDSLGDPSVIIDATLLGGPSSVALVYREEVARNCYPAYTVRRRDGVVTGYACF